MRPSTIIIATSAFTMTLMLIMAVASDQKMLAFTAACGCAGTILSQFTIRKYSDTL